MLQLVRTASAPARQRRAGGGSLTLPCGYWGELATQRKKYLLNLYQLQVLAYRLLAHNRGEHAMETSLSAAPSRSDLAPSTGKAGLAAAGSILGALAASTCCIVPLALFTLGISGAWIGNFAADFAYMITSQLFDLSAGIGAAVDQTKQLADLLDRETEIAAAPDKVYASD